MEDASSWDRWVTLFEDAGYLECDPGWQAAARRTNGFLAVSLK
jgi:hypothetical protein